ncbi:MAG: manganese efflux pump [Endomicrobiaceae bacterium]|nr:manganese efflux pump [Endomicrobiaceae bacterium]
MNYTDVFFLGIALSIDATIVSFAQGLIFNEKKFKFSVVLALFVGFFQFLMPLIGWLFANSFYNYFKVVSHIIIFIIFTCLGIKFIYDALKSNEEAKNTNNYINFFYLLTVGTATSIDALGAGFSLRFYPISILISSILIGLITFINSIIGFYCGQILKKLPSKFLEILGGLILIGLGIKALLH